MKKQLMIAGGSGLIGSALRDAAVGQGWEVTILSRSKGSDQIQWDPQNGSIALTEPRKFDAIVNLAGTSIAGARWTETRKKEIVQSRVMASQTLEAYLRLGLLSTQVYIGTSGIGIYGDRGMTRVDEDTSIPSTDDWMINTVLEWEASHRKMETLGIRTVVLRTGIVLSTKGGALREVLRTAPFGVLGYFGSGQQIWPWIHIDDHIRIIMHAIEKEQMQGTYQTSAPHPVSNKELVVALSKQFSPRRVPIPVPGIFLAMMLGKLREILFQSCNGYPGRLLKEGFRFGYATIEEAVKDLVKR